MFKSEGRIIFIMHTFTPHVNSEYAEAWGKAYALRHVISSRLASLICRSSMVRGLE